MAKRKWLRRHSLERRLFVWLLTLSLVPALTVVLLTAWLWSRSFEWSGASAPWEQVAASGRDLFDEAGDVPQDSAFAAALERHRRELSASLVLARRWSFIGERAAAAVPFAAVTLALLLAALALIASRRIARELGRPIGELVDWTGRIVRGEPLPPPPVTERREVREFRVLREAFRVAARDLAAARERAIAAERVRVWGEMARRVAHEMKNLLTPLRLASRRLDGAVAENPALSEPVGVIVEETARLEELAGQFAALGRPAAGPRSLVDLRELALSLLASDVPAQVTARLDAPADVPLVEGYYDELVRAVRNLIRNAVEAMEGQARRELTVRIDAGGRDVVEIAIADTGPGLPAGAGERVFEPDFTTKQRGTGLGLALARQSVQSHGGSLTARNRDRGGAEFVIRIPAAGATPTPHTEETKR